MNEKDFFNSIISNNLAYFVSQQKNEDDLSFDKKFNILSELYKSNKMAFVQRYQKFLNQFQLNYIKSNSSDDQNVGYFIDLLIKYKLNKNVIKNRRYSMMKKLIEKGQYFSDHEMKVRNPLLYEKMIGRYLSDEEKKKLEHERRLQDDIQKPLSSFFLNQLENNQIHLKMLEKEANEKINSEEEDDDIEKPNKKDQDSTKLNANCVCEHQDEFDKDNDNLLINEKDKQHLRKTFIEIMYEKFLKGDDQDYFDYSQIDYNEEYDPIDLINQDAEDSYFDSN